MTFILIAILLVGAAVLIFGGIACGVRQDDAKRSAVGIVVVGAVLYGAAGAMLWHWNVAMTTALLVLIVGFAVFSTEEKLNG